MADDGDGMNKKELREYADSLRAREESIQHARDTPIKAPDWIYRWKKTQGNAIIIRDELLGIDRNYIVEDADSIIKSAVAYRASKWKTLTTTTKNNFVYRIDSGYTGKVSAIIDCRRLSLKKIKLLAELTAELVAYTANLIDITAREED